MRYGSVCSGIEAASVAWEPLGWEPAWFCEIDPFASALLAHRFPGVPNHGDFTRLLDPAHPVHASPIDVLVGGTPCQDFSVAGLRAGVEGDRGSLTLDFCRLVGVLCPKWVVWENVPGVLSSDGGRALGAFLGALGELGYGFAYRVLDAQYFGLAQRRKRVFVVGCAGAESSRAGAVLLEPESVRGDPPSRRKARKEAPADAGGRAAEPGGVVVAPPLTATNDPSRSPQSAEVTAQVASVVEAMAFNGYARTVGEVATPLMAEDYKKVEIGVLVPGVMAFDCDLSQKAEGIAFSKEFQPCIEVSEPITASERKGHSVVLQEQEPMAFDTYNQSVSEVTHTLRDPNGTLSDAIPAVVQIEPSDTIEDRSPTLKLGSGQGGNAPGVCFKASHFTRDPNGTLSDPSVFSTALSAGADRGDQDTLVFTGDGVVADPISANEGKTYTHEGTTFRMHNCVGQPPTLAFKAGQSEASWGGCAVTEEFSPTLQAQNNGSTAVPAVLAFKAGQSEAAGGTFVTEEFSPTLQAQNNGSTAVPAILQTSAMSVRAAEVVDIKQVQWASGGGKMENDTAQTLRSGAEHNYQFARISTQVRRLTPRCDTLQQGGISHGDAEKAGPRKALRDLREAVGEEAFTEWGLGVLASFLPQSLLQSAVHGIGVRCPTVEEFGLVHYALSCAESRSRRLLQHLRGYVREGRPSCGWEPHEQRTIELGSYLSKLSQPGTSADSILHDLWSASEGPGLLRQALSAVQEVGFSASGEAEPALLAHKVRRLAPVECEFLQGFPRNYTLIPYRKGQSSDSNRYRALGNSMAVPCMFWIGARIAQVDGAVEARDTP